MSDIRLGYGELAVLPVYNSTDYEVVIQSGWRGPARRLCLCTHKDEAEDIMLAVVYALKNGVVK